MPTPRLGKLPAAAATTATAVTTTSATSAATATTITATTTAAAATVAATATATAAATLFTRASFVDRQAASINLFKIEGLNGGLGLAVVAHFDEAKTLAAASITILDNRRVLNLAEFRKELLKALACDAISQIANIQTHSHCTFLRLTSGPNFAFWAEEKGISVVIRQVGRAIQCGRSIQRTSTLRLGRLTDFLKCSTLRA